MGIYLPGTGTLGYADWSGAGFAGSQGILPNFYPPHVNVGPPILPPLHAIAHLHHFTLLPVWVNVASLNPWLSDFHTA